MPMPRSAACVTVASGAMLGGIGRIGGLDLAGTVTPGNSVGTLHVTGDATFHAGSSYQIEAMPDGRADAIVADGAVAILGGSALVLAQAGDWTPQTNYTVLTAAQGLSGEFDSASSSLTFLTPVLSYGADAVSLSLQRNDISFASVAQTGNQGAVATVVDIARVRQPRLRRPDHRRCAHRTGRVQSTCRGHPSRHHHGPDRRQPPGA